MAEPQNLRFRQFQAFFGLEGKNSNKKKILHVIFNYLSGKKKFENWTTFGFLWLFRAKKGKSKNGLIFTFNTAIESYGQIN